MENPQENRDFVLLGIKYEAAKVGGVSEAALAVIEKQIVSEAGEEWETHPMIVQGRNAVRDEHDLPRLGETTPRSTAPQPTRRSFMRRIFGS